MTVAEIAKKYNTTQNRLWRILDFYVSKELEKQDFSKEPIKTLSVDEIARKKHHVYLTNFLDIEGMNSKLRGFTKKAFGFKLKNLKITIFIALGKLNLTQA